PARLRSRRARIFVFLGLLGPGLIAANAGNDAGGVATYASAGAKYGYGLLWTIVLITISLAIVQMLAARMGVVTGKGLAELGREEREAVSGAVFANLVAASIIIATGATLFIHGVHDISSAADAARALAPFAGQYAEVLFGIGLFGASLLAAAILPIATSYV